MIIFWAVAGLLAAAASVLILWTARRAPSGPQQAPERSLYVRLLEEIDEQRARGLLPDAEYKSARAEAARRLLSAPAESDAPAGSSRSTRLILLAAVFATPLLALAIYAVTGAAGRPDQPYAARLRTWERSDLTQLPPPALAAVAEQLTVRRPGDAEAWRFLGRARLQAGDAFGAVQALERAARLAGTADDWAALGEALAVSNGGEVGRDAAAAFAEAVRRDPASVAGRYGLAQAQLASGDIEGGRTALLALAASLPAGDERRSALQAEAAGVGSTGERTPTR